jgi:hypothetical protein
MARTLSSTPCHRTTPGTCSTGTSCCLAGCRCRPRATPRTRASLSRRSFKPTKPSASGTMHEPRQAWSPGQATVNQAGQRPGLRRQPGKSREAKYRGSRRSHYGLQSATRCKPTDRPDQAVALGLPESSKMTKLDQRLPAERWAIARRCGDSRSTRGRSPKTFGPIAGALALRSVMTGPVDQRVKADGHPANESLRLDQHLGRRGVPGSSWWPKLTAAQIQDNTQRVPDGWHPGAAGLRRFGSGQPCQEGRSFRPSRNPRASFRLSGNGQQLEPDGITTGRQICAD